MPSIQHINTLHNSHGPNSPKTTALYHLTLTMGAILQREWSEISMKLNLEFLFIYVIDTKLVRAILYY